jgi:hypothetical protein
MKNFLESLFGSNWRTSLFGIIQFVAQLAYNYIQSLPAGAKFDWNIFGSSLLVAVLGLLAKDANVTGGSIQAKPPEQK